MDFLSYALREERESVYILPKEKGTQFETNFLVLNTKKVYTGLYFSFGNNRGKRAPWAKQVIQKSAWGYEGHFKRPQWGSGAKPFCTLHCMKSLFHGAFIELIFLHPSLLCTKIGPIFSSSNKYSSSSSCKLVQSNRFKNDIKACVHYFFIEFLFFTKW